jgi:hypothetical protein
MKASAALIMTALGAPSCLNTLQTNGRGSAADIGIYSYRDHLWWNTEPSALEVVAL